MSNFKYIPSFDGVRAIAVILVLLLHISYGFFKGGWIGVDLFFILSGYLITSLLQNEYFLTRRISFKNFYARRALRLFPPLIICIILGNILWSSSDNYPGADRLIATLAGLFYFSNLVPGNILGNLAQLWSLSVEEHFYFIWPIILYKLLIKHSPYKQLFIIILCIIIITLFRIYIGGLNEQIRYGIFAINSYTFTFCRFDSILMGVALAVYSKNFHLKISAKFNNNYTLAILIISFFLVSIFIANDNKYLINGGFILTNLLCLYTVFFAINFPNQLLLSNPVSRWLGRRSYGLYVYHFVIFSALEGFREPHSITNLLLVTIFRLVLSVIATELSFRFIEQPILKFKKNYQSS